MFTAAVFASLLLFGGIAAVFAFAGRPREALWYAWAFALYFSPVWLDTGSIGWPLRLDGRTMAALVAGLGFLMNPEPGVPRGRWRIGDALVGLLLGVMIVSEFRAGELRPLTGPEFARHWVLPYFVGRRFLRSPDDLPAVSRVFARVIPLIAAYGLLETFTHINPVGRALGMHFRGAGILESSSSLRMGLKRARGFAGHPITFGLMMTMALPWALEASRQAKAGWGPKWHRWLPWIAGAGAFSAVSRGSMISALMTAYAYATFRARRLRIPMIVVAVVVTVAAYAAKEQVAAALAGAVGETRPIPMKIHGVTQLYTGTNHRLLLFEVYRDAMESAGPFGYGFQLEGLIERFHIPSIFWSLDDAYILFQLKFGYVGLGLLLALLAWALVVLGRIAWRRDGPFAPLAAGLFGAVAAVCFALFTCSLESDYSEVLLFTLGLAGNLQDLGAIDWGRDDDDDDPDPED